MKLLKADFHIHTRYSMDSQSEPADIVKKCQELGINCIAISDHNAVEGAFKVQEIAPFKVIVAEEILTPYGEIMGMFLKKHIASGISIKEAIAQIREQGGLVAIPHPFSPLRGLRLNEAEMEMLAPQVDIIEVFNARCPSMKPNEKAEKFARKHNLPGTAGSDAHTTAEIGNVSVEMPDFNSPQEFLEALRKARIEGKCSGLFVHFHSTWAKLKKIF